MTNIMCWAYADIFTADATFSGFISAPHRGGQRNLGPADPYCASGRVMHTAEEWLDILRHASSDHTKPDWGKQLWLCGANHVELNAKFGERLKRWSVIRKVPFTRNATSVFALGERQTIYGNGTKVISRAQQGGQHITPSDDDYLHRLFGSIGGLITMSSNSTSADSGTNTTDTTAGAGSSTTTTTTGTNETPKEGCIVSNWGQVRISLSVAYALIATPSVRRPM